MSDSVKIMPRQPIEATFDGRDCYDNPSTVFIILDPDHWEADAYVTKDGWVEVSDPIVWDGEDETAERIRDMLSNSPFDAGSDRGADEGPDDAPLCIWAGDEFHDPVDVLFPGDSITVNGRWPFVIRASEVTP